MSARHLGEVHDPLCNVHWSFGDQSLSSLRFSRFCLAYSRNNVAEYAGSDIYTFVVSVVIHAGCSVADSEIEIGAKFKLNFNR